MRTQRQRVTVRARDAEDALSQAQAIAEEQYPDVRGIAGAWYPVRVERLRVPEGFEALFSQVDVAHLFIVDVQRAVHGR